MDWIRFDGLNWMEWIGWIILARFGKDLVRIGKDWEGLGRIGYN